MNLAFPAALWLLALVPLIVLLYMLRARRQNVPISSVLLWQRARRELAMQFPIRRLERNLLLLLQLMAAALAILALAQPQLTIPAAASTATVLVMDTSASMQATDIAPSRFEVARTEALGWLVRRGGPVMVVEAGAVPRVLTPFTDRPAVTAALMRLRPIDGPARLDQAVALAVAQRPAQSRSFAAGVGRPQVIVFTDRAGSPAQGVTYRVIGRSSRNVGIIGIRTEGSADTTHAVIQIKNAGPSPETVSLTVFLDDRRLLPRTLLLPPGGTTGVPLVVTGQGTLRAQIDLRDDLAIDNTAYAVAGAPPPRVVVIGEHDRVLEAALAAAPVQVAATRNVTAEALAAADVVILNHTPPTDLPPGNYLLFGTTASNLPVAVDGVVRGPQVLRWKSSHPVMRYVNLGGVQIGEALALRPRAGEVLAEGEVPLIWATEFEGVRAIVVGFTLQQSDLPLQVAFPIFLSNALTWLGGVGQTYQAGRPVIIPAREDREALVSGPAGMAMTVPASGGRFVIPSLDRAGIYTLRAGRREIRLAVNPAPEETEIAPVTSSATTGDSAPTVAVQERGVDLWPLLLLLALGVLVAEWLLWLRELPRVEFGKSRPRSTRGGPSVRPARGGSHAGAAVQR